MIHNLMFAAHEHKYFKFREDGHTICVECKADMTALSSGEYLKELARIVDSHSRASFDENLEHAKRLSLIDQNYFKEMNDLQNRWREEHPGEPLP